MSAPVVSKDNASVRMFENDFLEACSRVHPATPLLLYTPLVLYCIYDAFFRAKLPVAVISIMFGLGVLLWSLVEYLIHRHAFHYQPQSRLGKQLHFIVHGVHHDYPNDGQRLVMPPSVSLPLAVLFYVLFQVVFHRYGSASLAGFTSGYIFYDSVHYALHHFPMKRGIWRWLKNHHLRHHFADDHAGYGVSSPLWDYVFGTIRREPKLPGDNSSLPPATHS